jgi:hypothetical protein
MQKAISLLYGTASYVFYLGVLYLIAFVGLMAPRRGDRLRAPLRTASSARCAP